MDSGQEVSGRFVVPSGDGAILFESGKEVFDQMSGLVQMLVERPCHFSVCLGRDNDLFACCQQGFDDALIGIERLICNHGLRRRIRQQHIISFQVAGLSRRQVNTLYL